MPGFSLSVPSGFILRASLVFRGRFPRPCLRIQKSRSWRTRVVRATENFLALRLVLPFRLRTGHDRVFPVSHPDREGLPVLAPGVGLGQGGIGVAVFFVLRGFVISQSVARSCVTFPFVGPSCGGSGSNRRMATNQAQEGREH
jgi:hypothetical protein